MKIILIKKRKLIETFEKMEKKSLNKYIASIKEKRRISFPGKRMETAKDLYMTKKLYKQ